MLANDSFQLTIDSTKSPTLEECIFQDDHIAVIPDRKVACEAEMLAGFVALLVSYGATPNCVSVMLTDKEFAKHESKIRKSLTTLLGPEQAESISLIIHQSDSRKELAMLGASESGEPIGLARTIVDADFVIPIGFRPVRPTVGDYGPCTPIFPRFADIETQNRFSEAQRKKTTPQQKKKLTAEVQHVAQLLGVILAVEKNGESWECRHMF